MVDQDGRTLLFVEMCARVVKNNLRLRLRERMRYIRCPPPTTFSPCRSALVQAWTPVSPPVLRFCGAKNTQETEAAVRRALPSVGDRLHESRHRPQRSVRGVLGQESEDLPRKVRCDTTPYLLRLWRALTHVISATQKIRGGAQCGRGGGRLRAQVRARLLLRQLDGWEAVAVQQNPEDLRTQVHPSSQRRVLQAQELLGRPRRAALGIHCTPISHKPSAYWRLANSHSNRQDDTDLEEIGLRVKHMNIISYAQGHCLHLKGNMAWNNNPINAQRFFNMAMEKYEGQKPYARARSPASPPFFRRARMLMATVCFPFYRTTTEALSSAPWSSDILVNCAEIATKFLEGEEKNLANLNFSINHPKGTYSPAHPFACSSCTLPLALRLIWCWLFFVLQRKRQTTIFCGRYRATPTTATPSSSTPSSWIAAASSRRPKSFISDRSRCVHCFRCPHHY